MLLDVDAKSLAPSEAHVEMNRRVARTPRQLADELAKYYGHDFNQPLYIQAHRADRADPARASR